MKKADSNYCHQVKKSSSCIFWFCMQMPKSPKQISLWLKNGLVFLSHFNVKLVKMNGNELTGEKKTKTKTNEIARIENFRDIQ